MLGKAVYVLTCKCEVPQESKGRKERDNRWKCKRCGKTIPKERTSAYLALVELARARARRYGAVVGVVSVPVAEVEVDPFVELVRELEK